MAEIVFLCEKCGIGIEAGDSLCGGTVACPNCRNEVRVPAPLLRQGLALNGFVLEKVLGIGGMGQVWLSRQTAMNRKIALKILDPGLSKDKEFIERFLREAKNLAKLAHDNVVSVIDAGYSRGIYYMAVNFIDGYELGKKLEEVKVIPEKQALGLILGIAEGLCFAWNKHKIIHRDIKPANIMIDSEGIPKLMDLGISKCVGEDDKALTMTGIVIGTPYYISPEQGMGLKDLDFRCDIYSLGATLYHIVTGEVPYTGNTTISIITQHITQPFPPPRLKNPDVSEQCAILLEIMMAKNAEQRQQSWEQVIADIKNVMAGKLPETRRSGTGESGIQKTPRSQKNTIDSKISRKTAVGAPPPPASVKSSSPAKIMLVVVLIMLVVALSAAMTLIIVNSMKHMEPQKTVHVEKPAAVIQIQAPVQEKTPVETIVTTPAVPVIKIEPPMETETLKMPEPEKRLEMEKIPEAVSIPDNPPPEFFQPVHDKIPLPVKKERTEPEVQPVQIRQEPPANSAIDTLTFALKKSNPNFDENSANMQIGKNGVWEIDLNGQPINNISALTSLPISSLNLSRTRVSDISSLKNSKLAELHLDWTNVSDISPLKGLPLKILSLCGLQLKDFSILKDLPLENLDLGETNVTDTGFLKGKQLKILSLRKTDVNDLSPLKGMKLQDLSLFETNYKNLKPIEDIDLESIVVSGRMINQDMYKTLKKMKSLKFISPGPDIKMPAEEFFRRFAWAKKGQRPPGMNQRPNQGPGQGPDPGIRR
ncbi:MAG: protein kinase [Victivallales bacterium]